jgi:hypothetical protein
MKVAILNKFVSDYLRDEYFEPLYFPTEYEAMQYLADRNCLQDLLNMFVLEGIEE